MKSSTELCDLVQAIAHIVQRHGQHDFPSYDIDDEVQTASLCGLTIFIENETIIRTRAHDVDVVFNGPVSKAANDESVVSLSDFVPYSFAKGDMPALQGWLSRLTRFQTVFDYSAALAAE